MTAPSPKSTARSNDTHAASTTNATEDDVVDPSTLTARLEALLSHARAMPGAWVGEKAEWDTIVASAGPRLFAIILKPAGADSPTLLNIKLDPDDVIAARQGLNWVLPGYHQNKKHWVSLDLTHRDYDAQAAVEMLNESYAVVTALLTRRQREELHLRHAAGREPLPTWQW